MTKRKTSSNQNCIYQNRLISEIVDLWLELRAIRSLMEEDRTEEPLSLACDHSGPFGRFMADLTKMESDWENEKEHMDFFFQTQITPDLLAFEQLSEEDKYLLTN